MRIQSSASSSPWASAGGEGVALVLETVAELERERLQRTVIRQQEVNGAAPSSLGRSAQLLHALEQRIHVLEQLRASPGREPTARALALGGAHFNAGALGDSDSPWPRSPGTATLTTTWRSP